MKTTYKLMVAMWALLALSITAFAQVATNTASGTTPAPLPTTTMGYWVLGIAAVTPLIITGIAKLVPNIPKLLLPSLTTVVGIGLGLGINWLAQQNLGWVDMAQAGALAVFVREVFNQAVTKNLAGAPPDLVPPSSN